MREAKTRTAEKANHLCILHTVMGHGVDFMMHTPTIGTEKAPTTNSLKLHGYKTRQPGDY